MMNENRRDWVCLIPLMERRRVQLICFYADLQHHTFRIILDGKLHLAPIKHPQRVLDLATGTGIWAIEFGKSPVQCKYTPPPNKS